MKNIINSNKLTSFFFVFVKDGPYANFGGRDASRGLATFNISCVPNEYDDLSDLNSMEMDSVREWEIQFLGKCIIL